MKIFSLMLYAVLLVNSCDKKPESWNGQKLDHPRNQLTVEQLLGENLLPLIDMSYFARPEWAQAANCQFSGELSMVKTEINYPIGRSYYPGENIFPALTIDFISNDEALIPIQPEILLNTLQGEDSWNVLVGTGKIWHEAEDGAWCRASFPLTLTDSYIGQARNCVATFVYKDDSVSKVYLQCSQETADNNDHQVGDMRALLPATFKPKTYSDSQTVVENRKRLESERLPVYPLATIDADNKIGAYFDKSIFTHAPTSLGAIVKDGIIYLHPPKTRHGLYPYPNEMRHAVYSVSKSMTGALALFYFAERYGAAVFDELITAYVPALTHLPEWQGVTFSHTLNMVTGTEGGEDAARMYEILVRARTAEEAINNIAMLGDKQGKPGEIFNYASTNLFVLSYALQNYVEKHEGKGIRYWDLVHENVLVPLGADDFTLLCTVEANGIKGIPLLAYGALPTLDHVAKIAGLFSNEGAYKGQQLLHKEKCREAMGRTTWAGYSTNNDYRGKHYRHAFWATDIKANRYPVEVTYMLGYGGNYVWFFPDNLIAIRFMDEYDLDFKDLVKSVAQVRASGK